MPDPKSNRIDAPRRTVPRHLHPFPARMAPELALDAISRLDTRGLVLDPMCGSGTALRVAAEAGHKAVGFDLDPLAVLISRVGARRLKYDTVITAAHKIVDTAAASAHAELPWVDEDEETKKFTEFWFARPQRDQLRELASSLVSAHGPTADALRVALSRTIITKEHGASLARDVSHSRPHRVTDTRDYDVFNGFLRAADWVARFVDRDVSGTASVTLRDARSLPTGLDSQVDLVVTSPPYLNAIDYIRGHRLALVWMGHRVGELRKTRGDSIGSERGTDAPSTGRDLPVTAQLETRTKRMLARYVGDVRLTIKALARVLKAGGEAVIVVGDSTLNGVFIENSEIVSQAAKRAGLVLVERNTRQLPAGSRYLPPPSEKAGEALAKRMRSEVVMVFRKEAQTASSASST